MKVNVISENELEKFCDFEGFNLEIESVKRCGVLGNITVEDGITMPVEKFHKTALEKGYKNVIHALVHQNNMSRKMSEKYGEIMRKYHLYGMVTA